MGKIENIRRGLCPGVLLKGVIVDNIGELIKAKRAEGYSLFDANDLVRREAALHKLESAKTVAQIKDIVRDLIINTRYKNGVSG